MAIILNVPSGGRNVRYPRGGSTRFPRHKPWLTNAAGTPSFSVQVGASGALYPAMLIPLKGGTNWYYLWGDVSGQLVWAWSSASEVPPGSFTPSLADGSLFTMVSFAGLGFACENVGFFNWTFPAQTVVLSGTLSGPGAADSIISDAFLDTPGHTFTHTTLLNSLPDGPWTDIVTFPDGSSSPVTISWDARLYNGGSGDLTITGQASTMLIDFWNLYKTFIVVGYPGQWFGEWFNSVAWGSQVVKVLPADLAGWLASH